jgi:hypothetical protein
MDLVGALEVLLVGAADDEFVLAAREKVPVGVAPWTALCLSIASATYAGRGTSRYCPAVKVRRFGWDDGGPLAPEPPKRRPGPYPPEHVRRCHDGFGEMRLYDLVPLKHGNQQHGLTHDSEATESPQDRSASRLG